MPNFGGTELLSFRFMTLFLSPKMNSISQSARARLGVTFCFFFTPRILFDEEKFFFDFLPLTIFSISILIPIPFLSIRTLSKSGVNSGIGPSINRTVVVGPVVPSFPRWLG